MITLFIIFINDFHNFHNSHISIQYFLDDKNLLPSDFLGKRFSKHINTNLKLATEWIRANKLSLNVSKTEINIFKPKSKVINKILNFLWRGQVMQKSKKSYVYYQN